MSFSLDALPIKKRSPYYEGDRFLGTHFESMIRVFRYCIISMRGISCHNPLML